MAASVLLAVTCSITSTTVRPLSDPSMRLPEFPWMPLNQRAHRPPRPSPLPPPRHDVSPRRLRRLHRDGLVHDPASRHLRAMRPDVRAVRQTPERLTERVYPFRLSISPWDTRADRAHMACFMEFADEDAVRRARAHQVSSTKLHVVAQSPQLVAHFLSAVQPVQPLPLHPSSSRLVSHAAEVKQEPHEDRRALKRMSEGEVTSSNESTPKKRVRRSEKNVDLGPSIPSDALSTLILDPRTLKALAKSPLSLQSPLTRQASDKENYADRRTKFPSSAPQSMLPLPRRTDRVAQLPRRTRTPVPVRAANTKSPGTLTPAASTQQSDTVAHQEGRIQGIPHLDALLIPSDVPALSPIITLTYNRQPVTCDLRKLEDDPAKIIAVLKAIASCALERDKWMIVAVQYRIKGLLKSAIAVLDAMIEGMSYSLDVCV